MRRGCRSSRGAFKEAALPQPAHSSPAIGGLTERGEAEDAADEHTLQ